MTNSNYQPEKKDRQEVNPESQTGIEHVMPDEIIDSRKQLNERYGEVVWPNDRAGEMVRLSDELSRLRGNQLNALQSFEAGQIPSQFPMHNEVAKVYNDLQIQQLKAMQELVEAQKKAKLTETKAGNLNAAKEVSEFNQKRLLDYSKTGAKAIGFAAKYIARGALDVTKFTLKGLKLGWDTMWDMWYSAWGAHREYKNKYPDQYDI